MTDAAQPFSSDRLLVFEVAGAHYALPITDVAEVAEVGRVACVPTLPAAIGGVTNHHGDALPVIRRAALFATGARELDEPANLLVLGRSLEDAKRLALPVDRILGLVDGAGGTAHGEDALVERRPIGGRLVNVLDPHRLLMRAIQVIEESVTGTDAIQGGQG